MGRPRKAPAESALEGNPGKRPISVEIFAPVGAAFVPEHLHARRRERLAGLRLSVAAERDGDPRRRCRGLYACSGRLERKLSRTTFATNSAGQTSAVTAGVVAVASGASSAPSPPPTSATRPTAASWRPSAPNPRST